MANRQYNEQGYAFEVNASLTEYAQDEQSCWGNMALPSLGKEIVVLGVYKLIVGESEKEECVSYLLFDTSTQQPIDEVFGFEAMAVCIDKHKLTKTTDNG